ncbi:MAG TPA: ribonuclease HII [Streptosporangiaceae bacterium]|jgi:ribonuclease HII
MNSTTEGWPRPRPPRLRRDGDIYARERALARRGFAPVAGADEAGRGACAGPLVAAAVVLPPRARIDELDDSKALTERARERVYARVTRAARSWSVVVIPPEDVDRYGLHVCNIAALRRAVARLDVPPAYVLTDGFPVSGLGRPSLAIWKGDQVAACVAAASVVAKVTRDRIMTDLHDRYPQYDFGVHKGYVTRAHSAALAEHGPCPQHRFSYVNVRGVVMAGRPGGEMTDNGETVETDVA